LPDLMYVLRHPGLGEAEPELLRQALSRAPGDRAALRRQLSLRLARVAPKDKSTRGLEMARTGGSVFRLAALLPDSGNYESYARAIHLGLAAGLAQAAAATPHPIELERHPSGDDEPARALAVFDSISDHAGCVVGELLSQPTLALAAGA